MNFDPLSSASACATACIRLFCLKVCVHGENFTKGLENFAMDDPSTEETLFGSFVYSDKPS